MSELLPAVLAPSKERFLVCMLLAGAYAIWRGGWPERIAAIAFVLAWLASALVHTYDAINPQYGMFGVDLLLLLVLVPLAILSGRHWLMVAAAIHLLGVGAHLSMMLDLRIRSLAYFRTMAIWGYVMLLAMVLGTYFEASSERRRQTRASGNPSTSG